MEVVKITKNGVTKTVEKGAVSIYAMRGWKVEKGDTQKPTSTTDPYSFYGTKK